MVNALLAIVSMTLLRIPWILKPWGALDMGFFYVAATFASNASLRYIPYPLQILVKSCKSVVVLLSNFIAGSASYSTREVILVLLLSLGVALFLTAPSNTAPSSGPAAAGTGGTNTSNISSDNSLWGILLLLLSLCMDAGVSITQEKRAVGMVHPLNLMAVINLLAFLYLSVPLFGVTTQFQDALLFLQRQPDCVWDVVFFGGLSAAGQCFLFYLVRHFGTLATSAVTTVRKFTSVLLSVYLFGHVLNEQQWTAIAVMFTGLLVDLIFRYRKAAAAKTQMQAKVKEE